MLSYDLHITYLACLCVLTPTFLLDASSIEDVSRALANVDISKRPTYLKYLKQLTGECTMEDLNKKYLHIAMRNEDGEVLLKCILENPALLVDKESSVLEISEIEILREIKRPSHTIIPLPKDQSTLDEIFLKGKLLQFIEKYIQLSRETTSY